MKIQDIHEVFLKTTKEKAPRACELLENIAAYLRNNFPEDKRVFHIISALGLAFFEATFFEALMNELTLAAISGTQHEEIEKIFMLCLVKMKILIKENS